MLILAAGHGTRMRSSLPKVLHPLCGRPLLLWPIEAAREAGAERIVVVLGPDSDEIQRALPPGVDVAIQAQADGTAGAVRAAGDQIAGSKHVMVLSGDHPLIDAAFLEELAKHHLDSGAAATVTTRELDDPGQYGRIIRGADGGVERIVETKAPGDATSEELAVKEINLGTYVFETELLLESLEKVRPDNSQGELYLGDVLPLMRAAGRGVSAHLAASDFAGLGINTRADLAEVSAIARRDILQRHMLAGVTVTDPASTFIEVDVRIGADTIVEPYTILRGRVEIGSGCRVGPMTTLIDCFVGTAASVVHSYLEGCEVLERCTVGPFAYIRPGTMLRDGAKAGSFVEIKNSDIGEGTKVPHLSYIGDADVGAGSNIGAGNLTANYDGKDKHRTVIGSDVRTGVDTAFVAPVTVGDNAYTAAGSVITEDVPEGALGVARSRQTNIEGYAEAVLEESENEQSGAMSEKGDERDE